MIFYHGSPIGGLNELQPFLSEYGKQWKSNRNCGYVMKKRILPGIVLLILFVTIWWLSPASLMKGLSSENISRIEVFGGDSGGIFYIDDPNTIAEIVDNIKGVSLKKSKISLMYSGALFDLNFLNADGGSIYTITINGPKTIRKDPFFYNDLSESICFDLLMELDSAAVRK